MVNIYSLRHIKAILLKETVSQPFIKTYLRTLQRIAYSSDPAAAKLWTEYILTPGFGSLGAEHGSCRFPVTEGAALPEEAERMGLDMESTIDYDFEDAKDYASVYVEDFYAALVE